MGRSLTNNTSLQFSVETTLGVASTTWKTLSPNDIRRFGASMSKVARDPISKTRQREKGTIVDLDSAVEFEHDVTMELMNDILPSFMFSIFKGTAPFVVSGVTATGYTVASGGALAAGTLIYASGFATAANNGLKVVASGSTGTEIRASGLVVEAGIPATQNARVEIAGVEGASGDIQINASGNIISTALNWTLQPIMVGQWGFCGDTPTANQFANAANRGYFRIRTIAAGVLTIDRKSQAFVTDAGAGKTIRIFFGRFIRDVAVDHADFLEQSIQYEAAFKNLQVPGPGDEYEYAKGNYHNTLSFNIPLTSKATATITTVGQDTPVPTTVRATGANAPIREVKKVAMNTTSDIGRLRVMKADETGQLTDFKSLTFTIDNQVSGEKVVGQLGAKYLNTGNLLVGIQAQVLFTASSIIAAIRDNTTMSMDVALANDDGGIVIDLPAVTIEGGDKEFPRNETIRVNMETAAFPDPSLGFVCGISTFPYVPAS